MGRITAVLDACVLFSAPLRDLFLELANAGLFVPRWSEQIHDEWIRSVARQRPDIPVSRLQRTREVMDREFPTAIVTGYENETLKLSLPDANDCHVLAAAIHGGAELIVTFNLSDFPETDLAPFEIEALTPDDFLSVLLVLVPAAVYEAVKQVRCRLKNPPKSVDEYLITLEQQQLTQSVILLRQQRSKL